MAPRLAHLLPQEQWRPLERAHHERVDRAIEGHLSRRKGARTHPVEDFLFSYYMFSPAQLRRWHPGVGVALEGATERQSWKFHRYAENAASLDVTQFLTTRSATVQLVRNLVAATAARPAYLGCFGLHEWAMVYQQAPGQHRHDQWPLRLGQAGTDDMVETHQIRCSHFDAFRFFTEPARSLNTLAPERDSQIALEQPGCLHGAMDLYKWAYKLSPAIPSDLTADCFDLAREVRELDMRASPYDLRTLGYEPVQIETAAGKATYVEAQRSFAAQANGLRLRLVDACDLITSPG